jgi:hypothetical protein
MNFLRSAQGAVVIISAALFAGWAWVASIKSKAVTEYKSRVEVQERKIDAKAKAARKRAVSDADRVLERYYRDK